MELTAALRDEALALANALLHETPFGSGPGMDRLQVAPPLAVVTPEGGLAMIFVPVAADDRLAGYFLLTPQLVVHKYSSFAATAAGLGGAPSLAAWTEPSAILAAAERAVPGFEPDSQPVLSFDGVPDRIAWRVSGQLDRSQAVVFVAGDAAYLVRE